MTLTALARPCRQDGFSLVGLMVGMLLSMISILTALVLYRSIVHTSVDSRLDANLDGEMASAMSILQMELQGAGFGYAANGLSLFVPGGANPRYFYWRYLDGTTNVCRGFKVVDTNATTRKLLLLAPTTCDATTPLASLTWDDSNPLSELAEFRVLDATAGVTPVLPEVTISLVTVACFPYGMTPKAQYPQITISIDNAARRSAKEATATPPNNPFQYSFCLSNIGSASS